MMHLLPIADRDRFFNVNQKHLYEMTLYYPDEMDARGNYHYGWFDSYFRGDPERHAFYLVEGELEVGFALINRYSHMGWNIDHALAEFAIYPSCRKQGYGMAAAAALFGRFPGSWELKYHTRNTAAQALWRRATLPYHPTATALNDCEMVLSFTVPAIPPEE